MPIELSITWIILLNVFGWLAIQVGLAWGFTKLPVAWFTPGTGFSWEREGRCYEVVLRIKDWKDRLPDAAQWFGDGFAKRALVGTNRAYLERFIVETWRGELCHWCAVGCAPVFFLWNPLVGDGLIVAYALAANLPCSLVQRYNRLRLRRLLARRS